MSLKKAIKNEINKFINKARQDQFIIWSPEEPDVDPDEEDKNGDVISFELWEPMWPKLISGSSSVGYTYSFYTF